MSDDFKILDDGTIVRGEIIPKSEEDALLDEYYALDYEVNHRARPTQDPEKIKRYNELKKILNIQEENVFQSAKARVKTENTTMKAIMDNYKDKINN